jgi:hypothetical protein
MSGESEDTSGVSTLDTPVDWDRFPELFRATTFGNDIDAYLIDIGADPSLISSEDPSDNT